MKSLIALLPLIALGAPVLETAAEPNPAVAEVDAYGDLLAEFSEAQEAHEEALDAAESLKERQKIEKKAPIKKFWRSFDKLSRNDVRATLWMLERVDEKESDPKKRTKLREGLVKDLMKADVAGPSYGEVLRALYGMDGISDKQLAELFDQVLEKSTHDGVRAQALYRKAFAARRAKDTATYEELLDRCATEYAGTRYGTLARATTIKASDLEVGKPAPEFYAETIDGHGFKLSDYRGKVVLLDFYGFW